MKKNGFYCTLTDISEHVTPVHLMDSLGNVNNSISVVEYWVFDSNYKKALVLKRALFYMIFYLLVGKEQVADFETVFTSVRYIWSKANLNKD